MDEPAESRIKILYVLKRSYIYDILRTKGAGAKNRIGGEDMCNYYLIRISDCDDSTTNTEKES
jgi:hypothetical protein